MSESSTSLLPAFAALDTCGSALGELDAKCCDPGRSPSMKRLAATLAQARAGLVGMGSDPEAPTRALVALEDAGAQVGRLQVGCCAPDRLPLYADLLEGLTTAQLAINRAFRS